MIVIFVYYCRINYVKDVYNRKGSDRISKWKRKLSVGLAIGTVAMMLNFSPVMIQASSIMDKVTTTETTEDHAEDTSYSILRGNHLNSGTVKVQRLSSNEIAIYGLTQCHHVCDEVYLYLYLERKYPEGYGTYKYWKFTDNNVTSLSRGLNVAVPSGTYYRVRGYHAAKDGSKESTSTLTSGILIK